MKIINAGLNYNNRLVPLDLNKVKSILIHHLAARTATPEQIHQWHLNNGWAGAGYNEYIRKDGTVYIMRGDHIGAQCANYNSSSYGIAVEGSYDVEKDIPQAQYDSLLERVKYHKGRLPNDVDVSPHSKYFPTSCPGRNFPMDRLVNDLIVKPEPVDEELKSALDILVKYRALNSPDYWLANAKIGGKVEGSYAAIVIKKWATIFKQIVELESNGEITREQIRKILKNT